MRTTGTFNDVYTQAKQYLVGETCNIMDPVVRREDGEWMIESGLEPTDCDVEVTLEEFCGYWFPDGCPSEYCSPDPPTHSDITCWLDLMRNC